MSLKNKKIAIIGGGFSGLAVAYNLLKLDSSGSTYLGESSLHQQAMGAHFTIDIFDDEAFKNNGKAYQTKDFSHILNVPADKMGLPFADEEHFYKWLKQNHHPEIAKDNFAPRALYHDYLQEIILELKNNSALNFISEKVSQIKFIDKKYVLTSNSKVAEQYDFIVLACGLKVKNLPANFRSEKIIDNIWQFFNQEYSPYLEKISACESQTKTDQKAFPKSGTVLIVGTGLTMIDAVLGLKNNGFTGKIIACSKSCKLPLSHSATRNKALKILEIADVNLPLSQILYRLKIAGRKADDWRDVIHGLRSITQQFWQGFTLNKKCQFLRHLMSFWNIHRHRVARENSDQIMKMIADKKLEIIKGRLQKLEEKNQQIFATLNNQKTIAADLVLNAMGFDFSGRRSDLLNNLVEEKIIAHHPTGLGFEVLENHPNFYLAGGLLTGQLLEITAVPELRILAQQIANQILHQ